MHELPPILVAEDNDDDFHFLLRAIRKTSAQNPVLRFRDGGELIRFLEQIPPAELGASASATWLLLLDIGMPCVNGFEVLTWLNRRKGLPQIRAVVLSGFYHENDIKRARELGASEYCVKPITSEALGSLIPRPLTATV